MIGVERDLLNAVAKAIHTSNSEFEWRRSNMTVKRTKRLFNDEPAVNVYLHGHLIAHIWPDGWTWTLAGWNTKITRSRVNALATYLGGLKVRVHRTKAYAYGGGRSIPISSFDPVLNSPTGPTWPGRALRDS